MKTLLALVIAAGFFSCSTPNNSASTRISTAPMSNDPETTMPGVGAKPPYSNRIQQTTGTSPAPDALPDSGTMSKGTDSTGR